MRDRNRRFLFSFGIPECRVRECVGLAVDLERGLMLPSIAIEGDWSRADKKKLPDAFNGLTSHETIEYLIDALMKELPDTDALFDLHDLIGKNPPTAAYADNPNGLVFLKWIERAQAKKGFITNKAVKENDHSKSLKTTKQ